MNDNAGVVDYESEAVEAKHIEPNSIPAIILTQSPESGLWFLFEGMLNLKSGEFEVAVPIQKFKPILGNMGMPPKSVLELALRCSRAKRIPLWIP